VLGAAYLLIGSLAVPAIWMGRERLWSLKALNWGIVVLIIATLLVRHPFPSPLIPPLVLSFPLISLLRN
jgi:hypothetical protein